MKLIYILMIVVILYLLFSNVNENMRTVKGVIYTKGDSRSKIQEIKENLRKSLTKYKMKNLRPDDVITWENKRMYVRNILKEMQDLIEKCNIEIKLKPRHISLSDSRKKFIQTLPVNDDIIQDNFNLGNIKCFISTYDPYNYIKIAEEDSDLPNFLPARNLLMVNNNVYQMSPYGVIKYKANFNGIDPNSILNAALEGSLLNDINKYNRKTYSIVPFEGDLLYIKDNKFYDLITDKAKDMKKIFNGIKEKQKDIKDKLNTEKMEEEQEMAMQEEEMEEDTEEELEEETEEETEEKPSIRRVPQDNNKRENAKNKIIYMIKYAGDEYLVSNKKVTPELTLGDQVNKMLIKHDLLVQGVVPHYYFKNKQFQIKYLFLCNDNFYFYFENGIVSDILDAKVDLGFTYTKKLKYELTCNEHKIILDQLLNAKSISPEKKEKVLKRLGC